MINEDFAIFQKEEEEENALLLLPNCFWECKNIKNLQLKGHKGFPKQRD